MLSTRTTPPQHGSNSSVRSSSSSKPRSRSPASRIRGQRVTADGVFLRSTQPITTSSSMSTSTPRRSSPGPTRASPYAQSVLQKPIRSGAQSIRTPGSASMQTTPGSVTQSQQRGSKLHNSVRRFSKSQSELRKRFPQDAASTASNVRATPSMRSNERTRSSSKNNNLNRSISSISSSGDELASSGELNMLAGSNPFSSPMSRGSLEHAFTLEIESEESLTPLQKKALMPVCEAAHATATIALDRALKIVDLNDEEQQQVKPATRPGFKVINKLQRRVVPIADNNMKKESLSASSRNKLNRSKSSTESLVVDQLVVTPAAAVARTRVQASDGNVAPKSSAKHLKKSLKDVHGKLRHLKDEMNMDESSASVSATSSPDRSAATSNTILTPEQQQLSINDRKTTVADSTADAAAAAAASTAEREALLSQLATATAQAKVAAAQALVDVKRANAAANIATRASAVAEMNSKMAAQEAENEREKLVLLETELNQLHQQLDDKSEAMDAMEVEHEATINILRDTVHDTTSKLDQVQQETARLVKENSSLRDELVNVEMHAEQQDSKCRELEQEQEQMRKHTGASDAETLAAIATLENKLETQTGLYETKLEQLEIALTANERLSGELATTREQLQVCQIRVEEFEEALARQSERMIAQVAELDEHRTAESEMNVKHALDVARAEAQSQVTDLHVAVEDMQSRAQAAETALLETQEELKKQRRSACTETDEHAQVLKRCDEYRDKLKAAQLKCDRLVQTNDELERRVISIENLRGLSKESWEAVSAERDSVAAQLSFAQGEMEELREEAAKARIALKSEVQERLTLEHALEQATALAEDAVAQVEERKSNGYIESGSHVSEGGVEEGRKGDHTDLAVAGVSGGDAAVAAGDVGDVVGGNEMLLEVRMRKHNGRGRRCLLPVVAVTLLMAVASTLQQTILAGGGARMIPT